MGGDVPITLALIAYNKADVVGLAIESAARGSRRPGLVVRAPACVPADCQRRWGAGCLGLGRRPGALE
jgi:hypothetical protein